MAALFRTLIVRGKDPVVEEMEAGEKIAAPSSVPVGAEKSESPEPEEPSPVAQKVTEVNGYFVGNGTNGNASKNPDCSDKAKENASGSNEETEGASHPLEWMVRSCAFYKAEYNDCWGFKSKFNDYFVYGEIQNCEPHKENYDNCKLWREKADKEALEKLIQSERKKVRNRIRNHLQNDVWENRSAPPEDWNKPLPKEIEKEYEKSYLTYKREQFEKDYRKAHINDDVTLFSDDNNCVVM